MNEAVNLFISIFIKMFFLLTPFFVLSMFLAMTKDKTRSEQQRTALRVTFSVVIIAFTLFFFGNHIFSIFGITLDAFRIGAGALLFLSAVALVQGSKKTGPTDQEGDISVVPLAIPITVGPATVGALLVMGASFTEPWQQAAGSAGLLGAVLCVGILLYLAPTVERVIGATGLTILSKITGLILAALAAQIVFTGIRNFLSLPTA